MFLSKISRHFWVRDKKKSSVFDFRKYVHFIWYPSWTVNCWRAGTPPPPFPLSAHSPLPGTQTVSVGTSKSALGQYLWNEYTKEAVLTTATVKCTFKSNQVP